jgi:pimeloyl-ACP methyl ester carboxylesterase
VLQQGFATTGWMWRRQVRDLSGGLRCLTVDLPGHGRSAETAWESLEVTAKQVAEVIEGTVGGRASVVGMSLGGYVAAVLAASRPDLVPSAIVSGVSVVSASMSKQLWRRSQLLMQYSSRGLSAKAHGVPDEDVDGYRQANRFGSRQSRIRMAAEILSFTIPASAAQSDTPVLAVAGERESELVMRSLQLLADGYGRGAARYAPNTGQRWNGEAPELFNVMVTSWVGEQRLPPRLRDPAGWVR